MKPTARTRKAAAVKEEATRLHSKLTRAMRGPLCEDGCGRVATDAAHIVGRSFAHTRTDLANALALAAECHRHYTNWPADWMAFLDQHIGRAEYDRLVAKARAGVGVKFDWYAELDRLREIAEREL